MKDLRLKGTQKFMGKEIPVIEGGFGAGKKCICDKTIAELHNVKPIKIRERISKNIARFNENIDFVDLEQRIRQEDMFELLQNLGYSKQSITQAEHIYFLSERGYAKLIKIMDTDLAWEIHDKLVDEYFTMRELIRSDDQLKAKLLLSIYNGGQEGVIASKELTDMEVKAATTPLLETIDQQEETITKQDKQLKLQAPFVQAALDLQRTKNTLDMNQSAKALRTDGIEIGRNTLFNLLREQKVLMKDNTPYQKYIDLGLFKVVVVVKENHWGFKSMPVTRVTGKGLIFLNKKLRQWMGLEPLDIDIDIDEVV